MLLWDIIRDWFVQYVFGGYTSTGYDYFGIVGKAYFATDDNPLSYSDIMSTQYGWFGVPNVWVDDAGTSHNAMAYIGMGDWLSTTATIITLVALCLFLFLAVKWVFNVFRNTLERVGK